VSIEAKDDGGGGDNWTTGAISRAKLHSNHHHQQTNIQFKGQCTGKTKTMQIDDKQTMTPLIVSQLDIQTVDQFIYMGCILTEGGDE